MADIKQLISTWIAAWNRHDVETLVDLYAADYEGQDVIVVRPLQGRTDVRHHVHRYLHAFPDFEIEQDDLLLEDGRAALVWTAHGTHRGSWMNIPPTGRTVVWKGITLLTIDDGHITSDCHMWDLAGMLRRIGLLPQLSEPTKEVNA